MSDRRIKELIERVLEEGELDERTLPYIQSALAANMVLHSDGEPDTDLQLRLLDDNSMYEILQGMQDSHDVRLYTPELESRFRLHPMRRRASEILGHGLSKLPSFYDKAKGGEAGLLGPVERGFIYIIKIGETRYMVKPIQGDKEHIVAPIASELRVGPIIEEINEEWLAEEYVEGPELQYVRAKPNAVAQVLARVYGLLHERRIVYNDRFHDHLLLPNPERGPVLIDYGASHIGDDFSGDLERVEKYLDNKRAWRQFEKSYRAMLDG